MNLLDSLLDAIVRLEGDALVMHVGEKPYVVTTPSPLEAQRGPLSWGQVELSSRVLTVDAVLGMLVQILPLDQRQTLEDYGAIEHEIPAPEGSAERFTVIAARGGDDVWLEVRRRPKEEPQIEAAPPPALEIPPWAAEMQAKTATASPALLVPETASAPAPAEEIVAVAATQAVVSPELRKPVEEVRTSQPGLQIVGKAPAEEEEEEEEEVFEISLDAVSASDEEAAPPPIEGVREISQSAPTDEDVDALLAGMTPSADERSRPEIRPAPAPEPRRVLIEVSAAPEPDEASASVEILPVKEAPHPVAADAPETFVDEHVIEELPAEPVAEQATSPIPVTAAEAISVVAAPEASQSEAPVPVAPVAAAVPAVAAPAIAEAAAALEAFVDAAHTGAVTPEAAASGAEATREATAIASQRAADVMEEAAGGVPDVVTPQPEIASVAAEVPEQPAFAEAQPAAVPVAAEATPESVPTVAEEQPVAVSAVAEAPAEIALAAAEAAPEIEPTVGEGAPQTIEPAAAEATLEIAPAAQEQRHPAIAAVAQRTIEVTEPVMPEVARAAASRDEEVAPARSARLDVVPSVASPRWDAEQAAPAPAGFPSSAAPVEESRPALVVPISRSPMRSELPSQAPPAALAPVEHMLRVAAARGASTVYIVAHSKPMIRVDGEISALESEPTFSTADVERLVMDIAPVRGRDVHGGPGEWMTDVPEVGRVRCVTFREHRGPGVIFRMIPPRAISADQLGLPAEVQALCAQPDGLVLVTGARASGKSTLLSAFVDLINRTRSDHVITVESQINFVHESRKSFVSQREVRGDAEAAAAAVRSAFREDPDVLVIEDLRTAEIVSVAIEAAESGRLVLGSLSAPNTVAAIERLVELFSPERRAQVQTALAGALRGIVAQVLLRKIKGGRIAAREVLLNTPAVASLILEARTFQLPVALDAGRRHGMVPLTDSLAALVHDGAVHVAEAYRKALDRDALLAVLKRDGIDTSFAERLA